MRQVHFMQDTPCPEVFPTSIIRTMGRPKKKAGAPIYFKEWRKARGLSQEQAAERANLSQETISRIERGNVDYTKSNLEALAHAYGCEAPDLLRPPSTPENELAAFIMGLDKKAQARALKLIRAIQDDGELEAKSVKKG